MPRSTATAQGDTIMNRQTGNPAGSERTWNTTDRNTSGTADRSAGVATSAADVSRTAAGRAGSSDISRTTPGTTSMDRNDNRSGGSTATASDANRTTGSTGSGRGPDTQSASNTSSSTGSADRMATPTGATSANTAPNSWNSPGDVASANNAGNWDRSCFISPQSTSFVLYTQDGRVIRLDDASNQKVLGQLQSTGRVSTMNKIFRVRVSGTMTGDQFTITDIQI
jgi:hypothetical protein